MNKPVIVEFKNWKNTEERKKPIVRCNNGFAMPKWMGQNRAFFTNCQVDKQTALKMLTDMGYHQFAKKDYVFAGKLVEFGDLRNLSIYDPSSWENEIEIIKTDAVGRPVSMSSANSLRLSIHKDLDPYSKIHDLNPNEIDKVEYTHEDFIAYLKNKTLKLGKRIGGATDILSFPVKKDFAQVREYHGERFRYESDYIMSCIANRSLTDEDLKKLDLWEIVTTKSTCQYNYYYCLDFLCDLSAVNVTEELTKKGTSKKLDYLVWDVTPLILPTKDVLVK